MSVTVVDLQRAGDNAFLPKRDHQHGVYFRCPMCFIIVFYDDFPVIDRLSRGRADEVIVIAVIQFTHANVGQNVLGIGNRDGVCMDVMANNFTHLAERLAVDVTEKRQGFVGDIQCQLGLFRGAGFFLALHALNQHDDKTNTDAAQDHRDTDFRDYIQPQRGRRRPGNDEDHGQGFAQHSA